MKVAIGTFATLAVVLGAGSALSQGDHTEQRPSQVSSSSYCKSAPWVPACDTPEEARLRAEREARAKADSLALDNKDNLIECNPVIEDCTLVR